MSLSLIRSYTAFEIIGIVQSYHTAFTIWSEKTKGFLVPPYLRRPIIIVS